MYNQANIVNNTVLTLLGERQSLDLLCYVAMYTNVELLCCTPELIQYVNYTSIKKINRGGVEEKNILSLLILILGTKN